MSLKRHMVAAGFSLFRRAGLHRLAGAGVRGRGVILTLHRVRPADCQEFAPNALLEITPAFLDAALTRLRASGLDIVTLDEALRRLVSGEGANFAVLTFDDGFRDVAEHALPVLERHRAPFMTYIAPGLASRTARLWWVELEEAVRRLDHIELGGQNFSARDAARKSRRLRQNLLDVSRAGRTGAARRRRAAARPRRGGPGRAGRAAVSGLGRPAGGWRNAISPVSARIP